MFIIFLTAITGKHKLNRCLRCELENGESARIRPKRRDLDLTPRELHEDKAGIPRVLHRCFEPSPRCSLWLSRIALFDSLIPERIPLKNLENSESGAQTRARKRKVLSLIEWQWPDHLSEREDSVFKRFDSGKSRLCEIGRSSVPGTERAAKSDGAMTKDSRLKERNPPRWRKMRKIMMRRPTPTVRGTQTKDFVSKLGDLARHCKKGQVCSLTAKFTKRKATNFARTANKGSKPEIVPSCCELCRWCHHE